MLAWQTRWLHGRGGGGSVAVETAAQRRLPGNGGGSAAPGRAKPLWPLPATDSTLLLSPSGQALQMR